MQCFLKAIDKIFKKSILGMDLTRIPPYAFFISPIRAHTMI